MTRVDCGIGAFPTRVDEGIEPPTIGGIPAKVGGGTPVNVVGGAPVSVEGGMPVLATRVEGSIAVVPIRVVTGRPVLTTTAVEGVKTLLVATSAEAAPPFEAPPPTIVEGGMPADTRVVVGRHACDGGDEVATQCTVNCCCCCWG